MKKLFALIASVLLIASVASGISELGVRFGDVSGGDIAVDAIISIGQYSRIHADVSFGNGVGIDLLVDFLYKRFGREALNWYAGFGPFVVFDDPFQLGVVGELGFEYRFTFPISISADWRPSFRIIENTDLSAGGFGLNIRLVF
ncbi:MAG: outer membrane insertion C- signal [Candidatus Aegiribacteria sp.]|nr:outer membrane insertion C- signal [Candidatus Aegiribacteria sp.]